MMPKIKTFVNGRVCRRGQEVIESIYVDEESGMIVRQPTEEPSNSINLQGRLLAPAFLELQTNGCLGFHFTNFTGAESYNEELERISRHLVSRGVGGFYVTLPTVHRDVFKKILPHLKPRRLDKGAHLLGAHCEGPWLSPSKRGAHGQHHAILLVGNILKYTDVTLMQTPSQTSIEDIYGTPDGLSAIKLVTIAPELPGSTALISTLSQNHAIVVSLGHSSADYGSGLCGLRAGAKSLTHVFNAMSPLHHRLPGLAGLITASQAPFFSLIADGIHLHPASLTMAFRSNPERCILITDSIEMAGMPDGIYPGHAQVPHRQRKKGNRVTIEGTETLVGSCSSIEDCVKNLKRWSGCSLAAAVRCATENIAELMGEKERGVVEYGRRADFVILDDEGTVNQTWIGGLKIFDRSL